MGVGVVNLEENERGWDGFYLDSLINDHFPAYVGGPRFVNPIFYSLVNDVLPVCLGVASIFEGGACKRFLSEERASPSAFIFTSVLRSNANMIYTF